MNVCGMAILAISIWACSGQKKGTANVEVATDSVEVLQMLYLFRQIVQDILFG